ncbi:MAG: YceI family protein [Pseudomonadota bacterium]
MKRLFLALPLLFSGSLLAADWEVDGTASSLSFVSTKNVDVAESHQFTRVSGSLQGDGSFVLEIDLKSLDTKIPIRNDRIHEHLLDDAAAASVTGKVDPMLLGDIGVGESQQLDLSAELNLLGTSTPLATKVSVTAAEGSLQVVSIEPVLLNMRVLGLGNGLEKLREIAGLTSISVAVPVSFNVLLRR